MTNSQSPKRILVLALSGIGNLLMQMPTLETLKRKRPDSHITVWVAPRGTKGLAASLPYVDDVFEAPIRNSLFGHMRLISFLRKKHFDTAIIFSPGQLVKSAAYTYLAGIPTRIGNAYPLGNNPSSSWLLTDAINEGQSLHDIEQNLRLLEPLAIELPHIVHYTLPLSPDHEEKAKKLLGTLAIAPGKKIIGFHMGSAPDFLWKRWPEERFKALGDALIANHNAHILLFGGPDEEMHKESMRNALGINASAVSADLLTTAAVMQKCQVIISNDSGLMHLAAAAGAPVIGLFGPTNEIHTGPRGPRSHVLRAPGTRAVYNTEKNYSVGTEIHPTMLAITVPMVLDKIAHVVGQSF
jgi:heptosyltransferase-2